MSGDGSEKSERARRVPLEADVTVRASLRRASTRGGGTGGARRPSGPRELHGTRVSTVVDCVSCGAKERLDFAVPDRSAALCSACMAAASRKVRPPETVGFPYACEACSAECWLLRAPPEDVALLCERCVQGQEDADPSRIGGTWVDRSSGVRRRARHGEDSSSSG